MSSSKQFLLVFVALTLEMAQGFEMVDYWPKEDKIGVEDGGNVTLKCRANELIEQCTWVYLDPLTSEPKQACQLRWSWDQVKLTKSVCYLKEGHQRLEVLEDNELFQCSVRISNLSHADIGNWTCVLEDSSTSILDHSGEHTRQTFTLEFKPLSKDPLKSYYESTKVIVFCEYF